MPNARMSLCTQSVHSFSFPPRPLRTAPSRFPKTIRFGKPPAPHSDKRPRAQKSFVRSVVSMLSHRVISQGHGCTRPSDGLVSCAVSRRCEAKDPVMYGPEFGVVFLAGGSTYCIHTGGPRLPRPFTICVLRESATFGWP